MKFIRPCIWSGVTANRCQHEYSSRFAGLLAIVKMAHFYHAWAHAHEQNAVFLILRVELGDNCIQSRLGCGVQGTVLDFKIVDEVEICMAAGDGDDLLHLTSHDKRQEEVKEMDVADNVGHEQL